MTKPKRIREVLAANLRALMGPEDDPNRVRQGSFKKSGSNATIGRMLNVAGPRGPTIASLDEVAARFNLQPWQLLVEGLDPSHPPRLVQGNEQMTAEFNRRVAELVEEFVERRRH